MSVHLTIFCVPEVPITREQTCFLTLKSYNKLESLVSYILSSNIRLGGNIWLSYISA